MTFTYCRPHLETELASRARLIGRSLIENSAARRPARVGHPAAEPGRAARQPSRSWVMTSRLATCDSRVAIAPKFVPYVRDGQQATAGSYVLLTSTARTVCVYTVKHYSIQYCLFEDRIRPGPLARSLKLDPGPAVPCPARPLAPELRIGPGRRSVLAYNCL